MVKFCFFTYLKISVFYISICICFCSNFLCLASVFSKQKKTKFVERPIRSSGQPLIDSGSGPYIDCYKRNHSVALLFYFYGSRASINATILYWSYVKFSLMQEPPCFMFLLRNPLAQFFVSSDSIISSSWALFREF